jgi:hypothetical protein
MRLQLGLGRGVEVAALGEHPVGVEAGLVALGEVGLVLLGQQLVLAGVVEVLAHEVGRERRVRVGLGDVLRSVVGDVVDDLEVVLPGLLDDALDPVVTVDLRLVELLELRDQHEAALPGALEELLDSDLGGGKVSGLHLVVPPGGRPAGGLAGGLAGVGGPCPVPCGLRIGGGGRRGSDGRSPHLRTRMGLDGVAGCQRTDGVVPFRGTTAGGAGTVGGLQGSLNTTRARVRTLPAHALRSYGARGRPAKAERYAGTRSGGAGDVGTGV